MADSSALFAPNTILPSGRTTVYLSSHPPEGRLACFPMLAAMNKTAVNVSALLLSSLGFSLVK